MPKFLFQPDPKDGIEFFPIPIDIHLGIIRIPTEEILDDFGINTTESVIVGTDRIEVLNMLQTAFARGFERYGKLKESNIRPIDYQTKQVWIGIRRHIKDTNQTNVIGYILLFFFIRFIIRQAVQYVVVTVVKHVYRYMVFLILLE
jgi:hypothetical protein